MRIKLIETGRIVFFILFLAAVSLALWFTREFSPQIRKTNYFENSQNEVFKEIFSDFDNKPWEDSFGVFDKEIYPVYRFKGPQKIIKENELELIGYAFNIEGVHMGRKWQALMGVSPVGDVLGIQMMVMSEPMGLKQVFYDERNFFNFYVENKQKDLKKLETPYIRGASLLSKSLDDEIRRSLSFFEKNIKIFEKRHPRQKNIEEIMTSEIIKNREVERHDSFS